MLGKMRRVQWTIGLMAAAFATSAAAEIVVYPEYPREIERDYAYAVRVVQGDAKKMVTVYNHCEKSPLSTRTRGGDVNRRFCEFAFSGGPVRVDIVVAEDVQSYAVFPSRLGLRSSFSNGVISVTLEKPASFGIRLNDYDKTILSVFADAPEDPSKVPAKGAPGVLYIDKWTDPPGEDGVTVVEPPVKEVYIAPGAVLNSRLVVRSPGAYVHGRGMMLDPFSDVFRFEQVKNQSRGFMRISASGVTVEDVKLVDARTFNYCTFANGVTLRNVRALASMMCSDGITCGGRGLTVDGAWLYVGDNALVVSGIGGGALFRNVAIGTSCKAIFPQGSNYGVEMENVDVFRADEGTIENIYNGVLRRNTKWSETGTGEAKKEPGPQDLRHHRQQFHIRNLSAVDCVLYARFFVGGNMGTLPKVFGFENVAVPHATGKDDWRTTGRRGGAAVVVRHDSAKLLDTDNYTIAITNLWVGGERLDAIPGQCVVNPERMRLSVTNVLAKSAIPAVPDRHEVGWTCPYKRYIGASLQRDCRKVDRRKGELREEQPDDGENLLADRPATRSAWQRSPSWLVKFDAVGMEDGKRVYRLKQCERNAGIVNIFTDAFLRHGNGRYRLSFQAKAGNAEPVKLKAAVFSNEKTERAEFVCPADGAWHGMEASLDLDFDLGVTELVAMSIKSSAPADEICFKELSLVKEGMKGTTVK
ncbi:MAG: hypothetical protein K6G91_13675 [Kiritimatiellae bacterium]|nr:hypothetical protein [Kiritimatiellia bacterium]